MTPPGSNSPALLRQEVLEEAGRRSEEILSQARQRAEAIVAKARSKAEQFRAEHLQAARAEAHRRTEAILATVAIGVGRLRAARVEELLQAIHDRAWERLRMRADMDCRKAMVRLSAEALRQMEGNAFRLRLCAGDHRAWGDELAEEIERSLGRLPLRLQLVADPSLQDGEVQIENDTGRQVWDLSLEARLERCWPELRRQIAAQAALMERSTP